MYSHIDLSLCSLWTRVFRFVSLTRIENTMNVLAIPSSVVGFAASSSLIVIMVLIAYISWTFGYPRPIWTHHTLDPNNACASAVERIFVAISAMKECTKEPQCTTVRRINAGVGAQITTLTKLYDECVAELSHAEMVDMCTTETLGLSNTVSPRISSLIRQWKRLGAAEVNTSDLITSDGSVVGKSAACAIADLRLVVMHVLPSIQRVHAVHTKSMTNTDIINNHVASEFVSYRIRVNKAFKVGQDNKAKDQAKLLVDYIKDVGTSLMAHK